MGKYVVYPQQIHSQSHTKVSYIWSNYLLCLGEGYSLISSNSAVFPSHMQVFIVIVLYCLLSIFSLFPMRRSQNDTHVEAYYITIHIPPH